MSSATASAVTPPPEWAAERAELTERIVQLDDAVHRNRMLSLEGARERLFTLAFRGLVYPQIWEDPVIDMEALSIRQKDNIVTIASGGCNVLSYLAADPARIDAVDLNRAGGRQLEASEHAQQGRLARAGLAEDARNAAQRQFEIDVE